MAGQMPPGIDPTNPPLALNPNGDGPNFDDPPSLAATTYGVVSLFIVLSASIVTMRLVANFRLLKKFMPDDCESIPNMSAWGIMPRGADVSDRPLCSCVGS
jgi:hypothetical protein